MWQIIAEQDRPQMTIWRLRITCSKTKATHTIRICNIYFFSTRAIVARTRTFIRLYSYTVLLTVPVLLNLIS